MLECSIADLNNKKQYKTLDEIPDSKTVVYNYHAIDNLTTTYNEILTSICKLGCEDLSYQQLHDKFMEDNELSMVLDPNFFWTSCIPTSMTDVFNRIIDMAKEAIPGPLAKDITRTVASYGDLNLNHAICLPSNTTVNLSYRSSSWCSKHSNITKI